METLEENDATQYVLHKNHLLKGSEAKDVLQVVNDIIALHATSAGTPYLSLFARMKNFQRKYLDEEFYARRNLVRLRAMRGTLFITSVESAPMLYQATKLPELQLLNLAHKLGISQSEYRDLSEKLHSFLKEGGKTLPEIRKALPKELVRIVEIREGKSVYKWTNVKVVLSIMMRQGIVISEKEAGTLRITKANRYVLFQEIYPRLNLKSVKSEEAEAMLVKCYIRAFGPVTEEDIAWWTGLNKADMKKALESIRRELLCVELSGFQGDHLMLEMDYKQFTKFKLLETCSISLLPYEDPYTKGYKVRDRLIDREREKTVYMGGGVQPTILLNGKIVGTWNRNIEEGKGPIKLRFFQQPTEDLEKEVIQKAKAMGRLMANQQINVEIERD